MNSKSQVNSKSSESERKLQVNSVSAQIKKTTNNNSQVKPKSAHSKNNTKPNSQVNSVSVQSKKTTRNSQVKPKPVQSKKNTKNNSQVKSTSQAMLTELPSHLRRDIVKRLNVKSKTTLLATNKNIAENVDKEDLHMYYSDELMDVLHFAAEESRRQRHNYVSPEYILLGILRQASGIAYDVLKDMGVNLKQAREEVYKFNGTGSGYVSVEIPYTPSGRRLLDLSFKEAAGQPNNNYTNTEHVLLAMLKTNDTATRVLEDLSLNFDKIRTEILRKIIETQTQQAGTRKTRKSK